MKTVIETPDEFQHETSVQVRVDDINIGGHLSNDAILRISLEAQLQFFKSQGWHENSKENPGVIMKSVSIDYISQAYHGDTLIIKTAADNARKYDFTLIHLLENKGTGSVVAKVKAHFFCFDYTAQKIRSIPQNFKALFLSK